MYQDTAGAGMASFEQRTTSSGVVLFFRQNKTDAGKRLTKKEAAAIRENIVRGKYLKRRDEVTAYLAQGMEQLADGTLNGKNLQQFEWTLECLHKSLPAFPQVEGGNHPKAKPRPQKAEELVDGRSISARIARQYPPQYIHPELEYGDWAAIFAARSLAIAVNLSERNRAYKYGATYALRVRFENPESLEREIRACLRDAQKQMTSKPDLLGHNTGRIYHDVENRVMKRSEMRSATPVSSYAPVFR